VRDLTPHPWWRHLVPSSVQTGALRLALVALVIWEGTLGRNSSAAHWSVGIVIGLVLAGAVVAGRGRQRTGTRRWAGDAVRVAEGVLTGRDRRPMAQVVGTVVWVVLIAATIGWDMYSFFHQAHDLPTLSRLFGDVTDHVWGRIVVFGGWLALGGYLAAGWRKPLSTVDPGTAGWRARRGGGPGGGGPAP
jgi:hypothetical protein